MNTLTKLATAIALTIGITGAFASEDPRYVEHEGNMSITRNVPYTVKARQYNPAIDNTGIGGRQVEGKVVHFYTEDKDLIRAISESAPNLEQLKSAIAQVETADDIVMLEIEAILTKEGDKLSKDVAKELFEQYPKLEVLAVFTGERSAVKFYRSEFEQ